MRTPIQITVIILSIVSLEALIVLSHLADRLPPRLAADIGAWGMNLTCLVVPALFVLYPATHSARRRLGVRVVTAVLAAWYLQLVFRMSLNLPALRTMARIEDPTYDGVGLNAALFVMGWVPPFIVSLVMVLLLQIWIWSRRLVDARRENQLHLEQQ
jgi:hypothetical protein